MGTLADNAFDAVAGPPEPRVTVAFTTRGAEFDIQVTANGPGLQAEVLEHIFKLGFSTKRGAEDYGIALSLVRQACNRLSGTVNAKIVDGATAVRELPVVQKGLSAGVAQCRSGD